MSRWHVWATATWGDGSYLTAGCDVNASAIDCHEAVQYGYEALERLGGICQDQPGDTLTITVKLVDV